MFYYGGKTYTFEEIEKRILEGNFEEDIPFILETLRASFFSQDGIFVITKDLKMILVNEASEKIIGSDGNTMVGRDTPTLVKEGLFGKAASEIVLKSKKQETIVQHQPNGKMILVTATPVFNEEGDIHRIISIVYDMPVLTNLYEDLLKKERQLESYMRIMQMQTQNDIGGIIAESTKMRNMIVFAEQVANNNSTILILGESGVGKGMIAKLIHSLSDRSNKPLISVNCGAIPEQLQESELFGYERGAFTGANREGKMGLIEAADGGTILLDEIGEMPMSLQSKFLTFLETGEITKVGGTEVKRVDVRVIAATNANLREMVSKRKFREDLYYRLNVIPIVVPSLRERKEDIIPLVMHFLNQYNSRNKCEKTINPKMLERLVQYDWPGNVRQLRNMVERMMVLNVESESLLEDLNDEKILIKPISVRDENNIELPVSLNEVTAKMEDAYISRAMAEGGSIRKAASLLGISPSMLYRKINR